MNLKTYFFLFSKHEEGPGMKIKQEFEFSVLYNIFENNVYLSNKKIMSNK